MHLMIQWSGSDSVLVHKFISMHHRQTSFFHLLLPRMAPVHSLLPFCLAVGVTVHGGASLSVFRRWSVWPPDSGVRGLDDDLATATAIWFCKITFRRLVAPLHLRLWCPTSMTVPTSNGSSASPPPTSNLNDDPRTTSMATATAATGMAMACLKLSVTCTSASRNHYDTLSIFY